MFCRKRWSEGFRYFFYLTCLSSLALSENEADPKLSALQAGKPRLLEEEIEKRIKMEETMR